MTELEAFEEKEEAVIPLVATTVNVYVVSEVRLFTVIVVVADVPVSPPGEEVAVYEVAPATGALRTTLAEVEDTEEAFEMTGVAGTVQVRMKGVPALVLVQTVPGPGMVVGYPVRALGAVAAVSLHVPFAP